MYCYVNGTLIPKGKVSKTPVTETFHGGGRELNRGVGGVGGSGGGGRGGGGGGGGGGDTFPWIEEI